MICVWGGLGDSKMEVESDRYSVGDCATSSTTCLEHARRVEASDSSQGSYGRSSPSYEDLRQSGKN